MQSFNRKIRNWLRSKTTLSNSNFMKSLPTTINAQSVIIKNNSMLVIRFDLYEYLLCYWVYPSEKNTTIGGKCKFIMLLEEKR